MTDRSRTVDVDTSAGAVRGFWRESSAAFLGIPFGEPPIGELRFSAPIPHASWGGILDATRYGATPLQAATRFTSRMPEPSIAGESFLVLNVFTPAPNGPAALPVLFFVHGGGFVGGSASSSWYDGAAFNRDGVVTVSVSYRLGFDGFGWVEDSQNNRALRDVILALEWVRENIGRFGGDPARVTVAGQSAGAVVSYGLLAAPAATGLFHQAWSISGRPRAMTLDQAEEVGLTVARLAGVAPTRAGFAGIPGSDMLAIQADAASRLAGQPDELGALRSVGNGVMRFGPIIDGELILDSVRESLSRGVGAGKAVVLGATDHEFNDVVDGHERVIEAVGRDRILRELGVPDFVADSYAAGHERLDAVELAAQWVTDNRYRRPLLALAEERDSSEAGTWLYRFSWISPASGRALHCLDLPFFFDCLDAEQVSALTGPHPPQRLADELHRDVVRFVTTGSPGWEPYRERRSTRVFDLESTVERDGYRAVRALPDLA